MHKRQSKSFASDFGELHNRLYGSVFSFVRLRVKDKEEAKDIVQDVFLKAYNSWEKIPDEKSAKNFLYIIAKQRMIDLWRSARSRFQTDLSGNTDDEEWDSFGEFDSLPSDDPLPEDLFEKSEQSSELMSALNRVRKEERELLILRFLDELEYKELARIYGISEDNVRQRVSRSLQNLKIAFAKNKEEQGRKIN